MKIPRSNVGKQFHCILTVIFDLPLRPERRFFVCPCFTIIKKTTLHFKKSRRLDVIDVGECTHDKSPALTNPQEMSMKVYEMPQRDLYR